MYVYQTGSCVGYRRRDYYFHVNNIKLLIINTGDFPGGTVKNLPANAGDTGSIPGLGRSYMPRSN